MTSLVHFSLDAFEKTAFFERSISTKTRVADSTACLLGSSDMSGLLGRRVCGNSDDTTGAPGAL